MNDGATGPGVFEFLQNQHSGAFGQNETVPFAIKRPGCALGIAVVGAKRCQEIEAGHPKGMNHAVGTTRQDDLSITVADHVERFAKSLGTRGTGGEAVIVRALNPKITRQMLGRGMQFLLFLGLAEAYRRHHDRLILREGLMVAFFLAGLVVLGGMRSMYGAFWGAMIIGLVDSLSAYYIAPDLKEVVYFAIFILILIFKPTGLFGSRA